MHHLLAISLSGAADSTLMINSSDHIPRLEATEEFISIVILFELCSQEILIFDAIGQIIYENQLSLTPTVQFSDYV
jgi:hypothetical protein